MCTAVDFALFLTEPFHTGDLSAQHLTEVPKPNLPLAMDAEEVLRVTCFPHDGHYGSHGETPACSSQTEDSPACCVAGSWALEAPGE